MAQIDPNTIQWDAPPQPVGKPVTGSATEPLRGGVILPGKPEKPEKPDYPSGYEPDPMNPGRLRAIPGGPADKPSKMLPEGSAQKLTDDVDQVDALSRALNGFNDDYAGSMFSSAESLLQGWNSEIGTPGQRNWWADFRSSDNIIRNKLFGASLTPAEQAAYDRTTITPSMDPKTIRENLQKRLGIVQKAAQRRYNRLTAAGYNPEEINAVVGEVPIFGEPAAPPPPKEETPPPVPAGATEGPVVTVTREQSVAAWGEPFTDESGNFVGSNFSGVAYDASGKPRIIGSVSDTNLDQPAPSFYESAISSVTGEDRSTPITEALPDWTQLPELTQLSNLVDPAAWQTAFATALGGSPMEIAQIVQSNFGTKVFQDEKGNYIFRSAIDGRDYAIKPGFQLSDVPRTAAQVTAGLIGGGGRTILGTAGREAGVQTAIEATQAGAGGTFNPADIAAAGVLGAAGQKIVDVAPAALQRLRNMRGGDGGIPPAGPTGGMPPAGPAAPSMGFEVPRAAPMASAGGMAPETPAMGVEAPRTFEAGETVISRAGGAMGTSPENVRVMQAEGLPVPVQLTQGAATRDPEQLAFEKEQLFSQLGGPLRRRAEENNLQALQNFDRFIDMTGGEAPDIASTGNAVINALSKGYEAAKNRVRVAYKAADNAGETAELVSYAPIVDFINGQTATTRTTLAPILQSTLEKIRLEDPTNSGQISIRAMEDIRKTINKAAQPGTPNEVYGGSVKDIIDDVTEGVGGDLYKKARQLRIDQANKFEKRAIVSRFVSNIKNMDDRRVPADRVFQSAILNEAPENIQYLKTTLKELGDDGRQAWSELQAATLRHVQEQATKNVNLTSDNLPVVSVAQLNKVVNELDKNGRLDLIFNPKMAQQVRDLRDVMQYVNTVPPGTSINNSGTARTLLALLSESGATAWMTGGIPVPVLTGIKVIRDQVKDASIKRKINRSLLPRSERD